MDKHYHLDLHEYKKELQEIARWVAERAVKQDAFTSTSTACTIVIQFINKEIETADRFIKS